MTEYDPQFLKRLKAFSIHLCKPGFLISDARDKTEIFDDGSKKAQERTDEDAEKKIGGASFSS